jgi:hypothetical protein
LSGSDSAWGHWFAAALRNWLRTSLGKPS